MMESVPRDHRAFIRAGDIEIVIAHNEVSHKELAKTAKGLFMDVLKETRMERGIKNR